MSIPKPSLTVRLTDPIRRRREHSRITPVELSTLCAMSLRGRWSPEDDALVLAYPAIARSVYLDVAASRRRLTGAGE